MRTEVDVTQQKMEKENKTDEATFLIIARNGLVYVNVWNLTCFVRVITSFIDITNNPLHPVSTNFPQNIAE